MKTKTFSKKNHIFFVFFIKKGHFSIVKWCFFDNLA